ncbi:hypothetical protein [Agromyces allii]|uniref:DUF1707 domain-containing protein n=1 Tax=Agromyces allii TaxID=393607 RepID=A0ABP5C2S5_9MICO|nr:hypothetical protein [Agromyces allii]
MPESDDDLARLQRLAFGSGASESERADAARELDALFEARSAAALAEREAEAAALAAATSTSAPGASEPVDATTDGGGGTGAGAATEPDAETTRRAWLPRAIGVGVAALLVGLLAGWQLGTTALATAEPPAATPTPTFEGPRTMADYLAAQPLAFDLPAADVFLRPATEADVPPLPVDFDLGHGPLELRYLLTWPGGPADAGSVERRYYAARDEVDLCLFVTTVGTVSTSEMACTTDGRFPVGGITSAAGTLSPDGTLSFPITW